jgi:HSP20 family protein
MTKAALEKTDKNANKSDTAARRVRPPADVYESDNAYQIVLDMVGVEREALTLTLEQETLKISARRASNDSDAVVFEREFGVPSVIDREAVAANYNAGVLTVTLPKQASSQPRRISVATA